MTLHAWALKWGVPLAAIYDLQVQLGTIQLDPPEPLTVAPRSEAYVASVVKLEAGRKGVLLFRNNVGALADANGRFVRYGLANETAAMNERFKSGDFIGLRPVTIDARHVGHTFGQFVSRETKAEGWKFGNTKREQAQQAWINLITAHGGDAAFTTGEGTL